MAAPTYPLQQGAGASPYVQKPAPLFANVTVLDGTWKEKDNTVDKTYKNGSSQTFLDAFVDPGVDAQCDWLINNGEAFYVKGQSIASTTDPTGAARTFLIVDVDNSEYGGFPIKQSVKLKYKVSQTTNLI